MLRTGTVVISRAGRDKGGLMAVLCSDESFVWLCDGKERPLARPKRKNARHITTTEFSVGSTEMKSDRALRKALAQLKER